MTEAFAVHLEEPATRRGIAALCAAMVLFLSLLVAAPAGAKGAAVVSELQGVQPPTSGLDLKVTGGDRFLLMTNGTGKQVIVKGYDDEPYLRFLPSRVVQVNVRSPSKYANEDRYALRPIPEEADSNATPKWQKVSDNGSYRWFDHRIHLMEKGTPPQVKDESKRTKIFDWSVPMTIGAASAKAQGTLEWVPESDSGTSPALFIGLGLLALLLIGGTVLLMRRRRPDRPSSERGAKPVEEAW